ncbi:MAG TPA: adenylate/guanylate cyclase domain-containing protein [Anaerolineae bacterium]|nr:adenylate/guanylate cyclase domain-containing protein [Anaerolineae bacterium]
MNERETLLAAIAAQEALRGVVPDEVIAAAVAALQSRLAQLALTVGDQRKQMTILFARWPQLTAVLERKRSAEAHQWLDRFWQVNDQLVAQHGGHVDKHLGDGLMAVWGVIQTGEDDARRAVRAGLALTELVWDEIGRGKVGINTGLVLWGKIGTQQEFTAIGDAVNVAARLEGVAGAGEVLISETTEQFVRQFLQTEAQALLEVKGKQALLQTYLVRGVRAEMVAKGSGLVGREKELGILQANWEEVVGSGRGKVVTVMGEAGVGKTALVNAFVDWWGQQEPLASQHYLGGRAWPERQGQPLALWRSVLKRYFRLDAFEAERQEAELIAGLQKVWGDKVADTAPAQLVARLLGFEDDGADSRNRQALIMTYRNQAFYYARTFFQQLARRGPVLICLEDVHWADATSLEFLQRWESEGIDEPVLVLALARPALGQRERKYKTTGKLMLSPLAVTALVDLIRGCLPQTGEIDVEVVTAVWERTGGNPLYITELIRMLLANEELVYKDGSWSLASSADNWTLPATLMGLLQARLERLPVEIQAVVKVAAVWGQAFRIAEVAVVGAFSWEETEQRLNELVAEEILTVLGEGEGAIYEFRHALLAAVAYERILLRERPRWHKRAAEWVVAHMGYNGRGPSTVGHHYQRANEPLLASDYYFQAGKQAWRQFASQEALAAYEQAWQLLPKKGKRKRKIKLQMAQEDIYAVIGDRDAQRESILALLRLTAGKRDNLLQAQMAARQGRYALAVGQLEAARAHLARAAASLPAVVDETEAQLRADILILQGQVAVTHSDYEGAQRPLQAAMGLAERYQLPYAAATSQRILGITYRYLQEWDLAEVCFERALAGHQALGDKDGESSSWNNLGVMAHQRRQVVKAMQYYQKALDIFKETGNRKGASLAWNNLGVTASAMGDYWGARRYLSEGLAIDEAIANRWGKCWALYDLGVCHHQLGLWDEGMQYYNEALVLAEEIGEVRAERMILTHRGLLGAQMGKRGWAQAERDLVAASGSGVQWQKDVGLHELVSICRGRVALLMGDFVGAEAYFRQAWGEREWEDANVMGIAGWGYSCWRQGRVAEGEKAVRFLWDKLGDDLSAWRIALQGEILPLVAIGWCYTVWQDEAIGEQIRLVGNGLWAETAAMITDEAVAVQFQAVCTTYFPLSK